MGGPNRNFKHSQAKLSTVHRVSSGIKYLNVADWMVNWSWTIRIVYGVCPLHPSHVPMTFT